MGSHPLNLAIRFLLELATLYAMGFWGWRQGEGWLRPVLAIGVPLLFAIAWGTFAVPDDPSRSGGAPVPIPGLLRLVLELLFFSVGVLMMYQSGYHTPGFIFGIVIIVHYMASYDRIVWLIQQ
ncbi:MAG: YrdB family protein [Candidatus Marinimicrobia bacterium]|nr:YrdB family protein [Candidatus Neomarinimicrobiota bacterium]MCF7903778.1 YrdB family protein [Candidatus Neomarinimicrobiota bacterium]